MIIVTLGGIGKEIFTTVGPLLEESGGGKYHAQKYLIVIDACSG